MKILRERPDQRRHHRVSAPLFVTLGGETLRADDWSIGGVKISKITDVLPELGQDIDVQITLPFQGFDIRFSCPFKVVRRDDNTSMIAGQFMDLGERERDLMEHFIEDLIRGCMSETRDTIQRIDTPVTPISTKPDVDPGVIIPVKRWSRKTIMMSGFYIMAGLLIFSYLALLIFTNFIRLEVDSAIITRPVIVSKALADGTVAKHHFQPGQSVKQGALITELAIPKLEKDMDEARVQVMRFEDSVARAKKTLGDAKRANASTLKISALRIKLSKEETELKATLMRQKNLTNALKRLYVKAPFDGKVVEIRKPEGSSVIYKEPLLILEKQGKPLIEAFLTQAEIMKIGLNDKALIYVPSLKYKAEANIRSVNRTSRNLDEAASRYFWQDPHAKTASVILELSGSDQAVNWPAGLPATVMFKRRRDNTPILTGNDHGQ